MKMGSLVLVETGPEFRLDRDRDLSTFTSWKNKKPEPRQNLHFLYPVAYPPLRLRLGWCASLK